MKFHIDNRLKYLTATIIVFLALVFIASRNYYRIVYGIDSVRSYIISVLPSRDNAGIQPDRYMRRTYTELPAGYTHCGPFLFFRASKPISLTDIAETIITYTSYYRISSLRSGIRRFNALHGSSLNKGELIIIPGSLPSFIQDEKNAAMPPLVKVKGIYLTGISAGSPTLFRKIPYLKKLGINAVVFDVKDVPGTISYKTRVPLAVKLGTADRAPIDNIDLFIRTLKSSGIYVIARIAVFHDMMLAKKAPKLAIHSRKTGDIWNRGSKEIWCDPTNKTVQDYNIDLAEEMAAKGVDEIQFDYIRFPTNGHLGDAKFSQDIKSDQKDKVISGFLKRAHDKLSPLNVRLSIDIFGVVAWGKRVDINKTGQKIEFLSKYCDYISPMLYPSHFNRDFDGYANPADHPYYFINEGCRKVIRKLTVKTVVIRPWLQAFHWKVSSYGPQYIIQQMKAADDSGAGGYLFWNASNDYKQVYRALSIMQENASQDVSLNR